MVAWQKRVAQRPKAATEPSIEARIDRVARRQLRLIRTDQLIASGVSGRAASRRVDSGRLFRIHQGVYATHPPPYTRDQRYLSAVLACGPDACLCDLPAAALQGFAETPNVLPQVSVSTGRGRSRGGIDVHRRQPVDPRDRCRVHCVPCTAPHLTLVDLAPNHTEAELETMLVGAESLGLLKRGRLGELIAERRGRRGIHRLERVIALEPVMARSELELAFLPIWRDAGVPRPRVNFAIRVPGHERPLTVDFAWPDIRLVVEADSQRFHGDWARAESDRERDQLLALAGWWSHRFVRARIVEGRKESATRLRALVDQRTADMAG